MNVRALILSLILPVSAVAQGFAGLGTEASEEFANPVRGTPFDFPADHGAHPDYRIEWWYLTANLTGPDGTDYGIQWTLFRSALAPGEGEDWQSPQVWFAHAALTTPEGHHVDERWARGGIGQAGAEASPFRAWIDEWEMTGLDTGLGHLRARGDDFAYDLSLSALGPLIFHGDGGYSVKSREGQASYYYSQPFFEVSGPITVDGRTIEVTGQAWLDREWSSQPLSDNQTGWDWFSLSFDDGHKLMGFVLRQTDGENFTSGTWITPEGETTPLEPGAFRAKPLGTTFVAERDIPTRWRVELPERGVDVTVEAIFPGAWMGTSVPYWEGPIRISGSHTGRGYLEMTGY